ncbi:MAG: YceI family protein [Nocardioides sp.]
MPSAFEPATNLLDDISGDYVIDASHSRIGFSIRHAMVTTVRGAFDSFAGSAHVDAQNPANSSVTITISAGSIDTGNADRDAHLASPDFFDAETYPEITFVSSQVSRSGSVWTIAGDLTVKDVTAPISIDFEEVGSARDPFGNVRVGFEGSTSISRKAWGLTWNAALETGGVLVSDQVKLDFDISAIKSA